MDIEIREDAKWLAREMDTYKIDDATDKVGIYQYKFVDKEVVIRCEKEKVKIYAECILRILDKLRELNKNGLTQERVNEFVEAVYLKHQEKQSEDDIFWPTIEAFSKHGIFNYDKDLMDAIHNIGRVYGCEPDSMKFIILKAPVVMSVIMSVTMYNIEITDDEYYSIAFSMLKAIMLKMEGEIGE